MAAPKGLVVVELDAGPIIERLGPGLYRPALAELVARATRTAERAARGAAPADMGALRRSITSETAPLRGRVFTALAYAAAVEEGRRPGARPPPPQALVGWMARHGVGGSAWVLARAIGRRGTKGRFFMRAGLEAARDALPGLLGQAARRIGSAWRT